MLYLHETHEVVGGRMADFEALLRDRWRPLMEADGHARLLWFWLHTHGTGPSYQAISITAIRDWSAWGDLVEHSRSQPAWQSWYADVGACRREVTGKLLLPTAWSPLQDADFTAAAAAPNQSPSLYLHDTGWPYAGKLDAYAAALGSIFYPATRKSKMIAVEACWTVCPGTGRFHEVVLLQRILNWQAFSDLLTAGERAAQRGEWMEEGLKYRDRWESKLLRPAAWSPRQ